MPMDALQSYGNNTACTSCVHVDPERLDFHIDPSLPRMLLACYHVMRPATECQLR